MKALLLAVFVPALLAVTLLCGCSSAPPAAAPKATPAVQPEVKPPELYSAKQCFSTLMNLAQRWQPDALPFHMESELNTEATGQGGKATVWRAMFASQNRGTMKSFVCSGSRLSSAPASGFTSTAEAAYPPNVPALIFDPSYFQTDSDKAYATTLEHGGSAMVKKDPQQPVIYILDWDPKQKVLLWTILYGKSQAERQGVCVVDATKGTFIRAGK